MEQVPRKEKQLGFGSVGDKTLPVMLNNDATNMSPLIPDSH